MFIWVPLNLDFCFWPDLFLLAMATGVFWLHFWGDLFWHPEMGDSLLSEPTLAAEPAPSPAAATPTPAAAEPGVSLAPPTSAAPATSPGAANMDLLGGQWASRKFFSKEPSGKLNPKTITRR